METIDQLLQETSEAFDQFWFVQRLGIVEHTDQTVTVQLVIGKELRVQAFGMYHMLDANELSRTVEDSLDARA